MNWRRITKTRRLKECSGATSINLSSLKLILVSFTRELTCLAVIGRKLRSSSATNQLNQSATMLNLKTCQNKTISIQNKTMKS